MIGIADIIETEGMIKGMILEGEMTKEAKIGIGGTLKLTTNYFSHR